MPLPDHLRGPEWRGWAHHVKRRAQQRVLNVHCGRPNRFLVKKKPGCKAGFCI
jgi:hypothetical protein